MIRTPLQIRSEDLSSLPIETQPPKLLHDVRELPRALSQPRNSRESTPENVIAEQYLEKRPALTDDPMNTSIFGLGHYYQTSELSVLPGIIVEPMLDLASESDLALTGTVIVEIFIAEDGSVDQVMPDRETSDLPAAYQDAAATAFRTAQFTPAQINGVPVASVLRVEVLFGSPILSE